MQTVLELPTRDKVEIGYDRVGRRVSEVRVGRPSYVVIRTYQSDGQLEQEYVETKWENRSDVVWRVYDYDEAGRLHGAYDLLGGTNWWFEWAQDWLVRWHSDDRNYVREFEYDEEGRVQQIWLNWESQGHRLLGYEYRFNVDGTRVYRRAALDRLEFWRQCGGLSEWYRSETSSQWMLWQQRLLGDDCGSCVWSGIREWNNQAWVDAALLPDSDYQPQAIPAGALLAACVVACACSAICAAGAVLPCVEQCSGSSDPIGCVKQCVGDIIRELPAWAQVLCAACLIGCAICLIVAILRLLPGGGGSGSPPRTAPEPHPSPEPHPEPPSTPPPGNPPPGPVEPPDNGKSPRPTPPGRPFKPRPPYKCMLLEQEEWVNPIGERVWLCIYTCPVSGRIAVVSPTPCKFKVPDPAVSPN